MIKKIILMLIMASPLSVIAQKNLKLWYKQPAKTWTEALPLGNGRLGAMVFGGVGEELIQLNESTYWSGGPVKTNVNPGAYANLLLAREALLKNSDYGKANEYAKKMQGYYSESYLPLGDLKITQDFSKKRPDKYERSLDIQDAIATTKFVVDGVSYQRQLFTSAPDQLLVIRFTSSKARALNIRLNTSNPLKYENKKINDSEIAMYGKAPSHADPVYVNSAVPLTYDDPSCRGMRYAVHVKAISNDGIIRVDRSGLSITNASEITVYVAAATSFNGFDQCPASTAVNEKRKVSDYLSAATGKKWNGLLARHLKDFHSYFKRVKFDLFDTDSTSGSLLPTDERLKHYAEGNKDLSLETLYFQFGRYLLISSSRPGGVAANLQGIWNKEVRPPWSSNYTTNINVQMNYWPAEAVNLSEMHLPFLEFIKQAAVTGSVTAKEFYHTGGWAVHHNSDIWALSNPVGDLGKGDPMWANWTMGAPWLAQHLWWHYEFTRDQTYLRNTAYPLMKGAAQFCLDFLIADGKGHLVTAPSVSPENAFIDENGKRGTVSIATTMDMSIIWDLFTNIIAASKELNIDAEFRDLIVQKQAMLYPLKIGANGDLQEWYKDWKAVDPHHRHVSHLFGLFPGKQISPVFTPEYAAAAKRTLELRGDDGTGWSLAWKINFWAKLLDGNHSYKMIRTLLRLTGQSGTNYADGGGTYANLFDAHPPFQIDGNFGAISGMAEMLLQSDGGEISLLPALPNAWPSGAIRGLKARGNFEIALSWKSGQLLSAEVNALSGGICRIRTAGPIRISGVKAKMTKTDFGYLTVFESTKGKKYNISTAQ